LRVSTSQNISSKACSHLGIDVRALAQQQLRYPLQALLRRYEQQRVARLVLRVHLDEPVHEQLLQLRKPVVLAREERLVARLRDLLIAALGLLLRGARAGQGSTQSTADCQ
jgi:hypothetical protein